MNKPLPITVVAGILISGNHTFLARRKKGKHLAGYWEFPGGKLEPAETSEHCLAREFKEELGVEIEVHGHFMNHVHQYDSKTVNLQAYFASHVSGDFTLLDHDKVQWVPISRLTEWNLAPADIPIAKALQVRLQVKRAYYSAPLSVFRVTETATILGELMQHHSNRALEHQQRQAWKQQIELLKNNLVEVEGQIYFEFSIPRMGKRVDNVLIVGDTVFVIEFKIGSKKYEAQAIEQAVSYALDLQSFHEGSHTAKLIPMLIVPAAPTIVNDNTLVGRLAAAACCNGSNLACTINAFSSQRNPAISPVLWETSRYKPTPTIIEAATALYSNHDVREITRSDATATNLSDTTGCLTHIVANAKRHRQKTICLVTGVPGAGKTLAGLKIAFDKSEAEAAFLSGNGPLVNVLREALARDHVRAAKEAGEPVKKDDALRKVATRIRNIHQFRDEYLKDKAAPFESVVIFDEAQRAWNAEQASSFMKRKRSRPDFNKSEPEFLIEVMDRHEDWCVIICLIGGGQEINTGEAGLEEWLHALHNRFAHWHIYYSNRVLDSKEHLNSSALKKWLIQNGHADPRLHLDVSIRSFRSEKLAAFVEKLLDLEIDQARQIYQCLANDFPIATTRSLSAAKRWLRQRATLADRVGLIASSGARRLRADGIDIKNKMSATDWFLNPKKDVRSSHFLELVASEFEVQGLELDWTCMAWGANFFIRENQWVHRQFKGTKWQQINSDDAREYLKNTHRVLLTRARQGMIIYVPRGSKNDDTRSPDFYDKTFDYLRTIGIPEVE